MDCTKESVMKCLLDLSAMGLEPDGRRAHLIPYGQECTLIIDYKGLVELIRRSGDVERIQAETVCEKDEFSWINGEVNHRINWRESRGEVQAVYAIAVMKSGEKQSATMTREEVELIRSRSRAGKSGPWVTDWAEMAKKTAVRRLSKMLPLSSEVMQHLERDDDQFPARNVTPRREVPTYAKLEETPAATAEGDNLFTEEEGA
jgi:recombination protein RecT